MNEIDARYAAFLASVDAAAETLRTLGRTPFLSKFHFEFRLGPDLPGVMKYEIEQFSIPEEAADRWPK